MRRCPACGSKERHRHQFCAFRYWKLGEVLRNARVLHMAPEGRFVHLFRETRVYLRADLNPWNQAMPVDVCTDMTEAGFKSGFFDFVYASHVLEHIENVDQAIREIYRVLNSRGRALLDVPVYGSNTVKLVERDHDGHLWHPGTDDWFKRYEKAGFDVDFFPSQRVHRRYGVGSRSPVTICQKVS